MTVNMRNRELTTLNLELRGFDSEADNRKALKREPGLGFLKLSLVSSQCSRCVILSWNQ